MLDGEPFDARTELYTVTHSVLEQIFGIVWVCERGAVSQKDEVGFDL